MSGESDAELLRAVLANSQVIPEVLEITGPQDMYAPRDQTIFKTMLEIWSDNETLDPATLVARIDSNGQLEACGGMSHLAELSLGNPSSATFHAAKVRRDAELRRLASTGVGLQQRAEASGANPDDILAWADDAMGKAINKLGGSAVGMNEAVGEMVDYLENMKTEPSTETGFKEIDQLLNGGFRGGQMIIVAARPGQGKSVMSTDFIRHNSIKNGKKSLMFSLEMSRPELMARITAAESTTHLSKLLSGGMSSEDWGRIADDLDRIEQAPIYIDDTPGLTMNDIKGKVRSEARSGDLGLVVIDYLGLIRSSGNFKDRQLEVSDYSRSCKLLAKECGVPIVVVAQLNREVEKRGEDATPKISDLRESGSLEMDCDVCILLHRPDGKDPDHARAGEIDAIIAKNRAGRMGTATLPHQLHYSRFVDWSPF